MDAVLIFEYNADTGHLKLRGNRKPVVNFAFDLLCTSH